MNVLQVTLPSFAPLQLLSSCHHPPLSLHLLPLIILTFFSPSTTSISFSLPLISLSLCPSFFFPFLFSCSSLLLFFSFFRSFPFPCPFATNHHPKNPTSPHPHLSLVFFVLRHTHLLTPHELNNTFPFPFPPPLPLSSSTSPINSTFSLQRRENKHGG